MNFSLLVEAERIIYIYIYIYIVVAVDTE